MSINIILNTLIHILILVLLFSFFVNNKNDNNTIVFILSAITIFLCYMIEFVRKPNIMEIKVNNVNTPVNVNKPENINVPNNGNQVVENFEAPINQEAIGPYNKLELDVDQHDLYHKNYVRNTKDSKCKWRKEPCDAKLLNKIKFTTPVGLQGRYKPDPDHSKTLPSVDGKKDSPRSMFAFTYNQCHPDCCPSTYTCDHGCVCTTEQQRKFLNSRGANRTKDIYPGI